MDNKLIDLTTVTDETVIIDDAEAKYNSGWTAQVLKQWVDWEIDQFIRGNHFYSYTYQANTNTVIASLPSELSNNLQTKIAINKVLAAKKALKGFITRGDRGIMAIPIDEMGSDEAEQLSKDLSSFCYALYKNLKIKKLEKEMADFGLRRSWGVTKYYWDPEADDGKGYPAVCPVDTYNFYYDPNGTTLQKCAYVIEDVLMTIEQIQSNENYNENRFKVEAENKVSDSYPRAQDLQLNYPGIAQAPTKNLSTVIVHVMHSKIRNKKTGKIEVWVTTWAGKLLLRREKTEFKNYPYVVYSTDNNPNEITGEAPLKPLIPINRFIDRIHGQAADYNNTYVKGAYKTTKGSGVYAVTNKAAKIFVVNKNYDFEQLPLQPMPDTPFVQEVKLNQYFDELSGVTQAMIGDKPEGTRTGVELENLQEAAANNIAPYRENMDMFLEELFTELVGLYNRHVKTPRRHPVGNFRNNLTVKSFVGSKAGTSAKESADVVLPDNIHITFCPDTLLGYTGQMRFQNVLTLFEKTIFDKQAVLETLGTQGYQDMIARQEQRQKEDQQMQMQMQAHQAMMESQVKSLPTAPKVNINVKAEANPQQTGEILETQGIDAVPGMPGDVGQAMKENDLMMQGVPLPPTRNATKAHSLHHLDFMKTDHFKNAPEHVRQAIFNHAMEENRMNMLAQMAAMPQGAPQSVPQMAPA